MIRGKCLLLALDASNISHYYGRMAIKSIKDKETQCIWDGYFSKKVPRQIQKRARAKLAVLNAAVSLGDMRFPISNHLEALKEDRKGQHALRVSAQWRICFVWKDGNAYNVEVTDYH